MGSNVLSSLSESVDTKSQADEASSINHPASGLSVVPTIGAQDIDNSSLAASDVPELQDPDAQQVEEDAVEPCNADKDINFVREILDELGIEVLFDGTFRRRDDEADASIESRLTLVEPTWDWLLDELLLTAGREEYRLRPSEAKMALERVTRDARAKRRAVVAKPLFEPRLNEIDDRAAEDQWLRLRTIFDGDAELFAVVLQHFIWQVKRKLMRLDVQHHLMPIITSAIQGSGKTTFVEKFLAPLDDLVAESVVLSDLVDPRSGDLFRFPVAFVDDVGSLDRRSIEVLKNVVTARRLTRRRLGTSSSVAIVQATTLIGTANRPVDELIVDETGNRRFAMLPFRNGNPVRGDDPTVWQTINEMDAVLLWRSVREDASSPIEAFLPALHAWQESSRPRGEVEAWLETLDVTSLPMKAITTPAGVKAQALYELFCHQTSSELSMSKFGTALPGLVGKPGVPFSKKVKTAAGTFYPLKSPK